MQLPKFEIWQVDQDKIGSATVQTPPPFRDVFDKKALILPTWYAELGQKHASDILKHKIYPTPKGKMGVHVNMLYDQDISCKSVSYEVVTRYDPVAGDKRKRLEAAIESGDENVESKKETWV